MHVGIPAATRHDKKLRFVRKLTDNVGKIIPRIYINYSAPATSEALAQAINLSSTSECDGAPLLVTFGSFHTMTLPSPHATARTPNCGNISGSMLAASEALVDGDAQFHGHQRTAHTTDDGTLMRISRRGERLPKGYNFGKKNAQKAAVACFRGRLFC